MREAVEQGAGEPLATHDLGPLFEGQIGGDEEAGPFVRPADDVEEEFGGGL